MNALEYKNHVAYVGLDANEHRVVWIVFIEDLDGYPIDRIPFRTREEADDLANRINNS